MAGMAFSQPASGQFMNALRTYAVVVLGQPLEDFVGAIRRPVINNNDFELHVALGEKVANRISDSRFFITCCNDDRALNSVVIRAVATVCRTKVGQRRQTPGPLQVK
jgi:hypothetical protein